MRAARRLLVAVPAMLDPNFFRTVVFMVEHNAEGALGIVLNRPSETDLGDVLPEWRAFASEPPVAFVGGPVQQQEALIGLARVARVEDSSSWQPLLGRVGTVDLGAEPDAVHSDLEAVRVFAGYAGWGPEQLESELGARGVVRGRRRTRRPARRATRGALASRAPAPGRRPRDGREPAGRSDDELTALESTAHDTLRHGHDPPPARAPRAVDLERRRAMAGAGGPAAQRARRAAGGGGGDPARRRRRGVGVRPRAGAAHRGARRRARLGLDVRSSTRGCGSATPVPGRA